MAASILILALLPLSSPKISAYNNFHILNFWWFICVFYMLTWLGGQHAEYPYTILSMGYTLWYFIYFLILLI